MPLDTFKSNWDDKENYVVSGGLLNALARYINADAGVNIGDGSTTTYGPLTGRTIPPRFKMGIAVIVDAADDCEEDADTNSLKAPCKKQHLYVARFRAYEHGIRIWQEYGQDFYLDAAPYRGG